MKREQINFDSYKYKIGQNLSRIRNANGLTQADMEDYGITRGYYGKVELGLYSISLDKIILISKAFGVNPSDLFKDENGNEIL